MLVKRIDAGELGKPDSPVWSRVRGEVVKLTGVPLGLQPSTYIIASRGDVPVGRVSRLRVKMLHNGSRIAFHLAWDDPNRDVEVNETDVFPDGAALLFPLRDDAPLITMGAEAQPVNAWHWRADRPGFAHNNVAIGLGTTRVTDERTIATAARWENGHWSVVFSRDLRVPVAEADAVQFAAGASSKVAFAIWEGANGERAGLKAFSPEWSAVVLEP